MGAGRREGSTLLVLGVPSGTDRGSEREAWRDGVIAPFPYFGGVAQWADYPVSHIDLGARHRWLMEQRDRLGESLQDPDWPGDAKVAGWWLWGQCSWIGSGWCEWLGKIPHVSDAGRGVQALGKIPHVGNAGMGVWTTGGATALRWLGELAARMERVRVVHGDWKRCLNAHYGGASTAIFFDPPYSEYEGLYHVSPVAHEVAAWCAEHGRDYRVALCGHRGDYTIDGWTTVQWARKRLTYSGSATSDQECIWFSPACEEPGGLMSMFSDEATA